jgi:predicted amidohydrolase YtcJ
MVDSIVFNAQIITMNDDQKTAEVMVVKDGKIIDIGDSTLLELYDCPSEKRIDAKKKYVYPGFMDAHCHFYGYAKTLLTCNLVGTRSWEEVLNKIETFSKENPGEWIIGRGWDQNDWQNKEFPDNSELNKRFPNQAVVLKRIDGHAVICNQKALEMAGIRNRTVIYGGEILIKNGALTGGLIDNAVDLISAIIPEPSIANRVAALQKAEKECFSYGLTSLADAGLDLNECLLLDSLTKNKQLSMYFYLMLNPKTESFEYAKKKGILETDFIKICSFKLYSDGALGSRGAKLKHDYCDRVHHSGMLIQSPSYYDSIVKMIHDETQYQVNTHCIGDSANHLILNAYAKVLKKNNDRRFRIEHAQIIDLKDIHQFSEYGIVPSVQPTHATSDGPWVKDRICEDRMAGAYAYKSLLHQNNYIALGTDFPVEYLQPLFTFYSAVFRKSAQRENDEAFLIGERLTPEEALKGMTTWAAKSCFLEHRKGQLKIGMDADFVILDKNLLTVTEKDCLSTQIVSTFRNGNLVHSTQ